MSGRGARAARVDSGWTYQGQPLIRIENRYLAADLVVSMGGKVLSLIDKGADRNVLWRAPRVPVRPGPVGANADDYFAGGWDDVFPTAEGCANDDGDQLPYMGEVWNAPATASVVEAGPAEVCVELVVQTPITPARVTRRISLTADEPLLRIATEIENVGHRPFDFCWGSHAALAVDAGMRIDVPAAAAEVTDAGAGLLGQLGERYRYPLLGAGTPGERDMSIVAAAELGGHALHALTELSDGWAAATDPQSRRGFGLRFDPTLHRCVWQWMSYGGFRGWHHLILEPWTAPQISLAAAREAGTALRLSPGESIAGTVTGVLYSGVDRVAGIAADGVVSGA